LKLGEETFRRGSAEKSPNEEGRNLGLLPDGQVLAAHVWEVQVGGVAK